MKKLAIYVHIPFCESKCIYCAFASFVARKEQVKNYVDAIINEITVRSKKFKNHLVTSIFFGGGTPSCIDARYIQSIMFAIKSNFVLSQDCEINIECNPNSATEEKLKRYKLLGFNRISFGVQSLNDDELKFFGRLHSKDVAIKSVKLAKKMGFEHINADLLIGLKSQTPKTFQEQVDLLEEAGVDHFSCYMLSVENKTPLQKLRNKSDYLMADDDCVDLYENVVNYLEKQGFLRYEISNFAKSQGECGHNKSYWDMTEYLGVGLSSHSFYGNKRYANTSSFEKYLSQKRYFRSHAVTTSELKEETIMLALRTRNGLDLDKFKAVFNEDLLQEKAEQVRDLVLNGFIEIKDNNLYITKNNFGKSNAIILKLC